MILRIIEYVIISLLVMLLLFWSYIQPLLPFKLTVEQIIGVLASVIIVTLLSNAHVFRSIRDTIKEHVINAHGVKFGESLSEAVNEITSKHTKISDLRVFAISSGQIQPLIEASKTTVSRCDILLWAPGEASGTAFDGFDTHIKDHARRWKQMHDKNRINSLTVSRYDFFPTEYMVIVNSDMVLIGCYKVDKDTWSAVNVCDPMIIYAGAKNNNEFIKLQIDRFESLKKISTEMEFPA